MLRQGCFDVRGLRIPSKSNSHGAQALMQLLESGLGNERAFEGILNGILKAF